MTLMIDQLFLVLLFLFAVLALQHPRLRTAVIFLGVFSLLASLVYLQHHSPDVAMAEAVIGSTLGTVLYLVALRKQEAIREVSSKGQHVTDKSNTQIIIHRLFAAAAAIFMAAVIFMFYPFDLPPWPDATAASYYRQNFIADTAAENAVTAIYLNYRVYDTLFETLTLLVSVLGVIFFSRFQTHETGELHPESSHRRMRISGDHSEILAAPIFKILYPFIVLLGFFTIVNGHLSPGGGFQGGAILSALLVLRYIIFPENDLRLVTLQTLEKVMFLMIILVPAFFIFSRLHFEQMIFSSVYLITMNALIGIKVCFGISIIFIRYAFYESR